MAWPDWNVERIFRSNNERFLDPTALFFPPGRPSVATLSRGPAGGVVDGQPSVPQRSQPSSLCPGLLLRVSDYPPNQYHRTSPFVNRTSLRSSLHLSDRLLLVPFDDLRFLRASRWANHSSTATIISSISGVVLGGLPRSPTPQSSFYPPHSILKVLTHALTLRDLACQPQHCKGHQLARSIRLASQHVQSQRPPVGSLLHRSPSRPLPE